jgi:hypothetical protein
MGSAPILTVKLPCRTPSAPTLQRCGSTTLWLENRAGPAELLVAARRAPPLDHLHGQPLPGTAGVNEISLGE